MSRSYSDKSASAVVTTLDRRSVLKWGAVAALGAGMSSFATRASAEMTEIAFGTGPVLSVSAFEFALFKGYFKNEGLQVTAKMASNGAATIAGVLGGSLQFAATNLTSTLVAVSRGLDLKIVVQEAEGWSDPAKAYDAIMVRADSKIAGPRDLQRKTVAVFAINSFGTLTTSRAVEKAGGDYKTIKWVELPQGDALNALAAGKVDAILTLEPFVTIGEQRGLKAIFSPYRETDPHYPDSFVVASAGFLSKNPKTAASFAKAMEKACAALAADPNAVRAILPDYMKLSPELVKVVRLPAYPTKINRDAIQKQIELAVRYKYIAKPLSLDNLIWSGAN